MKAIKQQTNNDVFDTLMVCGDLISYITNNPTVLFSLINNLSKNQKTTLLKHFCKLGNLKCVKCLVSNGADIYDEDDLEENSLLLSIEEGHLDIVKCLVSEGANIHINDEYPIYVAAMFGHLDIVEYLIEQGVDINHLSRRSRNLLTVTKILLKKLD